MIALVIILLLALFVLAIVSGTALAWLIIGHNPYHRGACPVKKEQKP